MAVTYGDILVDSVFGDTRFVAFTATLDSSYTAVGYVVDFTAITKFVRVDHVTVSGRYAAGGAVLGTYLPIDDQTGYLSVFMSSGVDNDPFPEASNGADLSGLELHIEVYGR